MKRDRNAIMTLAIFAGLIIGCLGFHVKGKNNSKPDSLSGMAKHGEAISILVDFGIDSANPRFFVYDNENDTILSSSKCAHGCGGGSTVSKPVFSNEIGSNCSSLGEYRLLKNSRLNSMDIPCIRIEGLSSTNSNAAKRGVVIHEAPFFADDISIGITIPVSKYVSQGCFGISTKTFQLLQKLVDQNKSIYLYCVYNKKKKR